MVKENVRQQIKQLAESKGWELIEVRKVTDNPLDYYLSFVLCKRKAMNDYCTHLCNHENLDNVYFAEGHYDFKTYESALEDFKRRQ